MRSMGSVESQKAVCPPVDPSPSEALDQMLRAACGIAPGQDYFLCDDDCVPIAFASSLPTGQTFELVSAAGPRVRANGAAT